MATGYNLHYLWMSEHFWRTVTVDKAIHNWSAGGDIRKFQVCVDCRGTVSCSCHKVFYVLVNLHTEHYGTF